VVSHGLSMVLVSPFHFVRLQSSSIVVVWPQGYTMVVSVRIGVFARYVRFSKLEARASGINIVFGRSILEQCFDCLEQ
jgi:hypothetical protein